MASEWVTDILREVENRALPCHSRVARLGALIAKSTVSLTCLLENLEAARSVTEFGLVGPQVWCRQKISLRLSVSWTLTQTILDLSSELSIPIVPKPPIT